MNPVLTTIHFFFKLCHQPTGFLQTLIDNYTMCVSAENNIIVKQGVHAVQH